MPEAWQCAGAGKLGKNWNDQAAKCKPRLCKGPDHEALTIGAGGNPAIGGELGAEPGKPDGASVGTGSDMQHSGEGALTRQQGQAGAFGACAVESCGFGVKQAAIAANAPVVAQPGIERFLAHGVAAQQDGFDSCEAGAFSKVDVDAAIEPAGREEDGFLRQPIEMGTGADGEPGFDLGGTADGAVDALAGLGGEHHATVGGDLGGPVHVVAASQAAGGVDQHSFERVGMGMGEANLGASVLVKGGEMGAAIALLGGDAASAAGALHRYRSEYGNVVILNMWSNDFQSPAFSNRANALS